MEKNIALYFLSFKMIKLKPFEAIYDGYGSVAEELVSIVENSQNFTLTEYEGRDEFYSKYMDYYGMLIDTLNLNVSPRVDLDKIEKVTQYLKDNIRTNTANLKMFLYAYYLIILYIDVDKEGSITEDLKRSSFEDIIKMMQWTRNGRNEIPFLTPRGVFGVNTFLYLYFKNLSPIGVTLTPHSVHGIRDWTASYALDHDLNHSFALANMMNRRDMYHRILRDQSEIGVDKCKAIILLMFIFVHESSGENIIKAKNIVKTFWTDYWKSMISNKYYTPEYLNIEFPKKYGIHTIDLHDIDIVFKSAYGSIVTFSTAVKTYQERFMDAAYQDYKKNM